MPPPIPVMGVSEHVSALAGTWSGEYASEASGRSGSIRFSLAAGSDTAYGDVLMLPWRTRRTRAQTEINTRPMPDPRTFYIAFVQARGDSVYGFLDPYEDPECSCVLVTQFRGRLLGDRIEGGYRTLNMRSRETTEGTWSVRRKRGGPAATLEKQGP
jgi:hypothetical protein